MKIVFLSSFINHARHYKRVAALKYLGIETKVLAFERDAYPGKGIPGGYISLGKIEHGKFLKRLIPIIKAVQVVYSEIKDADVIYAFDYDMAFLGIIASKRLRHKPRLVYEVGDIHEILLGKNLIHRSLRNLDKFIMNKTHLLVVTSEAFVTGYFKGILGLNNFRYFVLENKLAINQLLKIETTKLEQNKKKIRIGYFGKLNCNESWEIIKQIVQSSEGKIEVYVRGESKGVESFEPDVKEINGITYEGTYISPDDLPKIYGKVDIVWGAARRERLNSLWARRCRFYESCFFQKPIIAFWDSEDGRIVEELKIGVCVDFNDIPRTINRVLSITCEDISMWHHNIENLPKKIFVYTDDHERLIKEIQQ